MKQKIVGNAPTHKLTVLIGLVLFFAYNGFAMAEAGNNTVKTKEPLVITLTVQKVISKGEKESFVAADKVKPGEIVEYRANYANVSKAVLNAVVADLPVPKGMDYMKDSAHPVAVLATVDSKVYQPVPLKRKVKDKTGREQVLLVPLSEYRGLRWLLGSIPAGKELAVSARMQVSK
jgi:uncharacterized repeat protein (TIGR01451 family)